ncbi:MAG: NUDIX hydrolase [Dehalococcoidia bacterium]|nr:NUDIX hydrolase [Dehalococcoidia bacterium]
MTTKKERVTASRHVYRGRAIHVRVDSVTKPNGKKTTREVVEHAECVVIMPVDSKGNVLLVRQYRHAVDERLLELPAGSIDPGETAEEAAVRELREEIGCRPTKLQRLGGFYAAPGYCTEYLHFFRAAGLKKSPLTAEDTDEIEVVPVKPGDIPALIESGQICDAKTIAGFRIASI